MSSEDRSGASLFSLGGVGLDSGDRWRCGGPVVGVRLRLGLVEVRVS